MITSLPAATEWDSRHKISNWEALDFEQGLTPQQMQAAHLYYVDLLRQADIAREIGVTPRTISNWRKDPASTHGHELQRLDQQESRRIRTERDARLEDRIGSSGRWRSMLSD